MRQIFSEITLPNRYALLILLPVIALVASMAIEAGRQHDERLRTTGLIQRLNASTASNKVEAFISRIREDIDRVAMIPWERLHHEALQRRDSHRELLARNPAIIALSAGPSADTENLFVSRNTADYIGPPRGRTLTDDSLKDAEPSADPLFGRLRVSGGTEPTVLVYLQRDGVTPEYGRVELNLKFLSEVISGVKFGETGSAYLTDSEGLVIAHPDARYVLLPELAGPRREWVSHTNSGKRLARFVSFENIEAYGSAIRIAGTPWYLVVQQDAAEVDHQLVTALLKTGGVFLIGLVGAIFGGMAAARRIASPVLRLEKASAAIAGGDLGMRIDERRENGEFARLAGRFNSMASQLQSYTTSLEQKVAEKTAELERANRHKSEFLANMSHELRTPLNAVIGFSEALKAEYFGALNQKQKEYVKDINESGQHLLSLINDILDLSKIEAGKMELTASRFNMALAIDNALTFVRERALGHRIHLKADIAPEVGEVVADERKVKQILINLLSNAVKFSHPDGWVAVTAARDKNAVMVSVQDAGVGIANEDQAAIFDEFRQVGGEGSAKAEGTGLGLSLAKRFVELHGGRIEVVSEVGKGSTFSFWIPDGVKDAAQV
jgi:signal transduction histidine kinase